MALTSRSYTEQLLAVILRELPEPEELRLRTSIEDDSEQFNDLIFLGGAYAGLDPHDLERHPSRKLLIDYLLEGLDYSQHPDAKGYLESHLTSCLHCQEALNRLRNRSPEELLYLRSIKLRSIIGSIKEDTRKRLAWVLKDWQTSLEEMLEDLESSHERSE